MRGFTAVLVTLVVFSAGVSGCRRADAQHPVRMASNTKTFVAAAILRLWEEGRLELDARSPNTSRLSSSR